MCKKGPSCDLIPSTQSPIYSITEWKENERPRNLTSPNFLLPKGFPGFILQQTIWE